MVAMHDGTNLQYFAQDHLSSTSIVMDNTGGLLSHNRYMPFGEVRDITGSQDPITQTDFGYTGQRNMGDMGLMDYRARFYSPLLGRFTQPDTIVPNPGNPQSFNRFSYVINNPIMHIDPSGHLMACNASGTICSDSDDDIPGSAPSTPTLPPGGNNGGGNEPGGIDEDVGWDPHEDIFHIFERISSIPQFDCADWVPNWVKDDVVNINMALFILNHPNATFAQKLFARSYLGAWIFAGVTGGTGLGLLGIAGWKAIIAGSCLNDGDCTNEAQLIAERINQLRGGISGPASGDGWKNTWEGMMQGKNLVLRVMNSGGGRVDYWRLAVDEIGAYTRNGVISHDTLLTHINWAPTTSQTIIDIITLIDQVIP